MATVEKLNQGPAEDIDRSQVIHEIDRLLNGAENLQDKCEARERKICLTILFGLLFLLCLTAFGELLKKALPDEADRRFLTSFDLASGLWYILFWLGLGMLCYRDFRRQLRDRRSMDTIVNMLREVHEALSAHYEFTALQYQHVKLRLRRFEIGPSADKGERPH